MQLLSRAVKLNKASPSLVKKPQPRTKHEVDRMTRCCGHLKFFTLWPDTRHRSRTRKWFYILPNAAMHCSALNRQKQ